MDAKENADFGIEDIHSSVDRDGDGIDDQTDILQGARDYIASQPVYKSQYYSIGYPDDQYGAGIRTISMASVRMWWQMRCGAQGMT